LVKPFLFLLTLLLLMVVGVGSHYSTHQPTQQPQQMVKLTHYATPSLSVGFDKPQTLQGAKHNRTYPEMTTTSPMEFVYVQ